MIRVALIFLLTPASCALHGPVAHAASLSSAQEIVYASTDLRHVIFFAPDGAHFGPPLEFAPERPPPPTRYFEPSAGVQCVSIGSSGNTTEYAIKRPIRAGERYQCGRTSFRVTRCFADCRAAVIEYDKRLEDNLGAPEECICVNSCLGILAFSSTGNMATGLPLTAELLRGDVGVLADPTYPDCRSF